MLTRVWHERVAWVGAAHVRTDRATETLRIVGVVEIVPVGEVTSSRFGASANGTPDGQRPTHFDASQTMCSESVLPVRAASRVMNCQKPATSCCSFR